MVDIDGDFGDILSVEVKRQNHFGTLMTFLAAIFASRTREWESSVKGDAAIGVTQNLELSFGVSARMFHFNSSINWYRLTDQQRNRPFARHPAVLTKRVW